MCLLQKGFYGYDFISSGNKFPWHVLQFFWLRLVQVPATSMEDAGFMTCTASAGSNSHSSSSQSGDQGLLVRFNCVCFGLVSLVWKHLSLWSACPPTKCEMIQPTLPAKTRNNKTYLDGYSIDNRILQVVVYPLCVFLQSLPILSFYPHCGK